MRLSYIIFGAAVLTTACNTNPKTAEATIAKPLDTLVTSSETVAEKEQTKVASTTTEKKSTTKRAAEDNTTASSTMSSESDNSAKAKKGWSKTAKGAVIGGVVGAGTGAVVNKKNRVAGAVIGGAVGAGAGAIIGNEMDKKDGRH